jgi:hypothetical protein
MDNMTKEEFLEKIVNLDISFSSMREKENSYSRTLFDFLNHEKVTMNDYITKEWYTGGEGGHSCWGHDPRFNEGEKEPEFTSLETIMEEVCPGITFLKYKKVASLVKEAPYGDTDYYGNTSHHMVHYIKLEDLYNKLVELDLI